MLQRACADWGISCELAAPFLIPRRPGDKRKHDRRDAIELARHFRAGQLVLIHIPSEEDERVPDLVRCRETFQREIVKSRHYILKFLRRRGFIYREGTHWTLRHLNWIRHVLQPGTLAEEDHVVLAEHLALLEYKLQRRDELDRRIEALALTPPYKTVVDRITCFRGFKTQAAMVIATELSDCAASRTLDSSWLTSVSPPPSTPPVSDDISAPSPRPAMSASVMSSSRPPGTTADGPPPVWPSAPSGAPGSLRHRPRLEMSAPSLQGLPPPRRQETQASRRHHRRS